MDKIRLTLLLFGMSLLSGCSDSIVEESMPLKTEPQLSRSTDFDMTEYVVELLTDNQTGWEVVFFAQSRSGSGLVFEESQFIPPNSMRYMGNGVIYYHIGEGNQWTDQLFFHEVFHVAQNGKNVQRLLTNEVEAYLAQYLYCEYLGKENKFSTVDGYLTHNIVKLAQAIDHRTGFIKNEKLFKQYFSASLRALELIPMYNDGTWARGNAEDYNLSTLEILLYGLYNAIWI